jgi:hypothetical protein
LILHEKERRSILGKESKKEEETPLVEVMSPRGNNSFDLLKPQSNVCLSLNKETQFLIKNLLQK